jgi:ABC-type transport system involved in multi-copper enzyme maturation permease subunit
MSVLASERLKLATTRTTVSLAAAVIGVVTLAAIVHILGFDTAMVDDATEQRAILTDIGVTMGLVFAAISGSLAITSEFRHGTIRPTLLKHPDRSSLLAAKLLTQAAVGAILAATATSYAIGLCAAFLRTRGLSLELDTMQITRLIVGAGLGGAGFAAAGLAIGTIVRNQVPVVVGLLIWTLFIENLLRAGTPSLARFAPGSLARAIAADGPGALTSPTLATLALAAVTTAVLIAAQSNFARRDIP